MKMNNARVMLSLCTVLSLMPAVTAGANQSQDALSLEETRHFLQRSGFADPPALVLEQSGQSRDQLISAALNSDKAICPLAPPAWTNMPLRQKQKYSELSADDKRAAQKTVRMLEQERTAELQYWWLSNLIRTENPLAAKMVLFWQNHFTSEQRKVKHAQLMYNQHRIFQQHALGNFRDLLLAVLQDPVMLIYLDNRSNRKNRPNENLARELLELFTLGEGHYSENDIREAARALTGYTVDKAASFTFRKKQHDQQDKTILGVTAAHDLNSLVELLLKQPTTAQFIVRKLWMTFVSGSVDQNTVNQLAELFRSSNYELKPVLQAMFESDAFWAQENRSVLIKSPAQFITDTQRVWQHDVIKPKAYVAAMRNMQQQLFNPPNVKGWQGGSSWINTNTLLARNAFVRMVVKSAADKKEKPAMSNMGMQTDNGNSSVQDLFVEPKWNLY